jgi:hypothetical protein
MDDNLTKTTVTVTLAGEDWATLTGLAWFAATDFEHGSKKDQAVIERILAQVKEQQP